MIIPEGCELKDGQVVVKEVYTGDKSAMNRADARLFGRICFDCRNAKINPKSMRIKCDFHRLMNRQGSLTIPEIFNGRGPLVCKRCQSYEESDAEDEWGLTKGDIDADSR